ncbi:MAG TPA: PQQ-dependent sugar dehydrogenase [Chitinophagaceae bacterium]|nr:PQQ-dependent sugar dehydrogenase [Chitinophagaceae bacterium]
MFLPVCSLLLVVLLNGRCNKTVDEESPLLSTKVIVENLRYPWEILWGPDNHIWMTERGGRISRVNPVSGSVIPLITINEVEASGEGGLLGMALHPDFANTPHVFVAYNYDDASGRYREKIVRFTYNGSTLSQPFTILEGIQAAGIHNGCRLIITPDRKLWITTGDAANQSLPQNKSSLNGKLLRLNLDGSIPADNPTTGSAVWSFGHRNAQGLVYANNILYSSEHGAITDDEVNIIEKGRNYGWPNVEGMCNDADERNFCNSQRVKEPIRAWTPTEAVCGLDYYDAALIPQWRNSLLLCTLKGSKLIQLKLGSDKKSVATSYEFFDGRFGRLRDVCISPEGKVYICTSNGNDKIIEITN